MLSFTSEVFIIGVNPYVPVPHEILQSLFVSAGKTYGSIPVIGELNGQPFTQTVVKYSGMWRLYLNGVMRKAAGVDVGDIAYITIAYDPKPRVETMPGVLVDALAKDNEAKHAFETLAPYKQKEILRYLNSAKTEETLRRNSKKVIEYLHGGEPEGLIVLTYRKSTRK